MQFVRSIFIVLLISSALFAQEATKENVKNEKEKLINRKAELINEKASVIKEIEEMKIKLEELKAELREKQIQLYIKKYGKDYGLRVASGKIWKGMTDKMLKDSWGKPDKVTKNVEKWGVFTQWYYGKITYFFRDGKLTDWEEKK